MIKLSGTYFCGNEASDYAKENGFLDYATLAKAFDAVLNNEIIEATADIGYWEQESGFIDNSDEIEELEEELEALEDDLEQVEELEKNESLEELNRATADAIREKIEDIEERIEELEAEQENYPDIFQYFIVSSNGAEILEDINEIVFYNDALDMYVWGVTHWGTSWDYVLTDIPLNLGDKAFED